MVSVSATHSAVRVSTEKQNPQPESCELRFIWGRMRTTALETASQIALRNCSRVIREEVSIYVILVKGKIHVIKHIFFQKFSAGLLKLLKSQGNSHHYEEF